MRRLPPALLGFVLIAGCSGHVADHIGPRDTIVAPQLTRYGMDSRQTQCVSGRLARNLSPRQLRLFARLAAAVTQGYFEPARLTVRDLSYLASHMNDRRVATELARATDACGVTSGQVEMLEVSYSGLPPRVAAPAQTPAATPPAPRPSTWLNLGAAGSGQSIAVDATTIEQGENFREAWFRLTDPGASGPSDSAFLLRIDCAARTINAKARRRHDASGDVVEYREYRDNPLPVEGGTVMEIAYLALCT